MTDLRMRGSDKNLTVTVSHLNLSSKCLDHVHMYMCFSFTKLPYIRSNTASTYFLIKDMSNTGCLLLCSLHYALTAVVFCPTKKVKK